MSLCAAQLQNTCKLAERGVLLNHALRETQLIFARRATLERRFQLALLSRTAEIQYLVEIRSKEAAMTAREAKSLRIAPLTTPTDLQPNAVRDIAGALNILLADMFGLYLKTKNFHWHVSGPHFRDYHLLLDEHGDQIFATTDPIAERVRKLGGTTMRSIGQITRLQRIKDNDADFVTPMDMLAELRDDNKQLTASMRETHDLCDEHGDVATASLLEIWIDEAERRTWFLFEATRAARGE